MRTPSDHAGADLRVSNPTTSAHFIEALNKCNAPLPWDFNEAGQITDAAGSVVGTFELRLASLIVVAVNTCGSFRATRRGD